MSGGCCGPTSAKVASIILLITGIISIIPGIVLTTLTKILFIGMPLIIGGAMFVAEGVLGLMFVNNAKNKCWMVAVNVVSIIILVISAVGIGYCTFFVVIVTDSKLDCNDCDRTDSSCNDECYSTGMAPPGFQIGQCKLCKGSKEMSCPSAYCIPPFGFIIAIWMFMNALSLISFATSIVLIISSCTCRKSNMSSAPI